jgi:hypothetical protein
MSISITLQYKPGPPIAQQYVTILYNYTNPFSILHNSRYHLLQQQQTMIISSQWQHVSTHCASGVYTAHGGRRATLAYIMLAEVNWNGNTGQHSNTTQCIEAEEQHWQVLCRAEEDYTGSNNVFNGDSRAEAIYNLEQQRKHGSKHPRAAESMKQILKSRGR